MTNRELFVRSLLALGLGAVLVVLAYFCVDRPVAYFVQGLDLKQYPGVTTTLTELTYIPKWLEAVAPLVLVLAGVRLAWGPLSRFERAAFAAALSILVGICFKEHLKSAFGRTWPQTWVGKPPSNPSLLGLGGTYGFFPFPKGEDPDYYASFPSGHTLRLVAFVAVLWAAYPRGRWLYVLVTLLVAVGLVGMNYHFVGDVIGGAVIGGITGAYAARFAGLSGGPSRPGGVRGGLAERSGPGDP
jgi:membrane-associated phospholipid phosphatase